MFSLDNRLGGIAEIQCYDDNAFFDRVQGGLTLRSAVETSLKNTGLPLSKMYKNHKSTSEILHHSRSIYFKVS